MQPGLSKKVVIGSSNMLEPEDCGPKAGGPRLKWGV